ncbi:hypothetical protein AAFF_G00211330 [Aldrovandia affinis]|uniref:Uncharacterized protein n=1 Tax=Aldrovandia affinis TaxID=143900 RepID=A0AAD7SXR5_9TELE|nr:hypothetical protein AAFF_G00211330 [Aldrovandia affinis]
MQVRDASLTRESKGRGHANRRRPWVSPGICTGRLKMWDSLGPVGRRSSGLCSHHSGQDSMWRWRGKGGTPPLAVGSLPLSPLESHSFLLLGLTAFRLHLTAPRRLL